MEEDDGAGDLNNAGGAGDWTSGRTVFDKSKILLNRSMLHNAYKVLHEAGPVGMSQQDFSKLLGIPKLESRSVYRYLERRGLADHYVADMGRQRAFKLVAKSFQFSNPQVAKINAEKSKMEALKMPLEPSIDNVDDNSNMSNETTNDDVVVEIGPGNYPPPRTPRKSKHRCENTNLAPSQQSARRLKRENTILEAIRSFKVIEDPSKLHALIREQEKNEDCDGMMDRKSLHRILGKLSAEGQIKTIKIKLTLPSKVRELFFVCDPSVDEKHTIIQSAVEQAKMKFSIQTPVVKKREKVEVVETSVSDSVKAFSEMEADASGDPLASPEFNRKFGRQYGLQPKFIRMREFHQLLFYLCRAYTGEELDEQDRKAFLNQAQIKHGEFSDEVQQELKSMPIYTREVGWKMFLSSLPSHKGWDEGWCLMCDVLLRLPLSLFVMLVNVTSEIEGLEEYLNHPIRCHYLIRALPSKIRSKLLHRRKYIFSIYEIATRLAYVGVVQFGPQKFKEKDQVSHCFPYFCNLKTGAEKK